jgi:leucyl/phenylalanyl-tRNA--protein transferase
MRTRYTAATRADPGFPWLEEDDYFPFPEPSTWGADGIVAVGGNLSPGMLLSAYRQGVFPWFGEDDPIIWQSPEPRFVLFTDRLRVSESMRKILRKDRFEIRLDADFASVIRACSSQSRAGQRGTWITRDMIEAYERLHEAGYAHSAEAYVDGRLAGGLYGISLGRVFFGESMFHLEDNASKAAFMCLALRLGEEGFGLIDSQARTAHMESLGGQEIPRAEYLRLLAQGLEAGETLRGSWAGAFPAFPDSKKLREIKERGKAC